MRKVWLYLILGNCAAAIYFYHLGGERLAVHFDVSGHPNGYMSGHQHAYFIFGLLIFVNAIHYGIAKLLFREQWLSLVNVPNKEYWISTPERRMDLVVKLYDLIYYTGAWTNFVLLLAQGLIYLVNVQHMNKPAMGFYFMTIVGLLIVTLTVPIFRMFKIPKNQ